MLGRGNQAAVALGAQGDLTSTDIRQGRPPLYNCPSTGLNPAWHQTWPLTGFAQLGQQLHGAAAQHDKLANSIRHGAGEALLVDHLCRLEQRGEQNAAGQSVKSNKAVTWPGRPFSSTISAGQEGQLVGCEAYVGNASSNQPNQRTFDSYCSIPHLPAPPPRAPRPARQVGEHRAQGASQSTARNAHTLGPKRHVCNSLQSLSPARTASQGSLSSLSIVEQLLHC